MGENWLLWLLIGFVVVILLIWLLTRKGTSPGAGLEDKADELRAKANEIAKDADRNVARPIEHKVEDAARAVDRAVVEPVQDALDGKPDHDVARKVEHAAEDAARAVERGVVEPAGDALKDAADAIDQKVVDPIKDAIEGKDEGEPETEEPDEGSQAS